MTNDWTNTTDAAWRIVLSGKPVNIIYLDEEGYANDVNAICCGSQLIDEDGNEIKMRVEDLLIATEIKAEEDRPSWTPSRPPLPEVKEIDAG